jgi:selenocysteine lyase/cysteine desulfurase
LEEKGLQDNRISVGNQKFRAPHLLCLKFAGGMPAGLVEGLAAEGIHVASRIGRLRVSPHVYNDDDDADRFVAALAERLGK